MVEKVLRVEHAHTGHLSSTMITRLTRVGCFPDNNASANVLTRPMNCAPFTPTSVGQMRGWLNVCLRSHIKCKRARLREFPTRLIHIPRSPNHQDRLRLMTETSRAGPYAALSYCWGPAAAAQMKTTKGTIARWSGELPWQEIPPTIQDAVRVTYQLGFRYLWVDALCIIQDDEEDKDREIPKMSAIYSDADITIVASRASSVQEGFLHRRRFKTPVAFRLPFRSKRGQLGTIQLVMPQTGRWNANLEPLDTRAWAMQERLLARRALEFGTRQTRFFCQEYIDGQCDGWTPYAEYSLGRAKSLPHVDKLGHVSEHPLTTWDHMVSSYTHRSLTNQEDRIFAISGLAEAFSKWISGQYLAGLWSAGLPGNLLWEVHNTEVTDRPTQDQAPSWSWIAVKGSIKPKYFKTKGRPPVARDFEIVEVSARPKITKAPFGALSRGFLRVKARLKAAEWKQVRGGRPDAHSDRLRVPCASSSNEFLALRSRSDARELDGLGKGWSLIHLLLVLESQEPDSLEQSSSSLESEAGYSGLMLKEEGVGVYSRLGMFSFTPTFNNYHDSDHPQSEVQWQSRFHFQSSWFADCVAQTIILI